MNRYFATLENNKVILSEGDEHHLLHVMRAKQDEFIEAICDGTLYEAQIVSLKPLSINVIAKIDKEVELSKNVTLFFALAKGEKNDFVIQKASELGATKVVLFPSKRSIVRYDDKDINKKLERFHKIAKEASEQSHRLVVLDVIYADSLKSAMKYKNDINYVAYEKVAGDTSKTFEEATKFNSISYMVGPEGGFEEEEINFLKENDFQVVSLGKRILRTETAAVYGLSVLSFLLEK